MKWYKKIIIAIVSLIVLIFLLNVGLNWWIARRLPQIINENNNSPYQITYKDIEISLLDRNLHATDIILIPKFSHNKNKQKAGYFAKVKSIDVKGFNLWNIITTNKITAKSLIINYPEATLFKTGEKPKKKKPISSNVEYFNKIIYVSDIYLNHGNFGITDIAKNRRIMKLHNISFKIEGILVTDQTLSEEIPFAYRDYKVEIDSAYYRKGAFYDITTSKITATKNAIEINSPKMIPIYGRRGFVNVIQTEKDLYTIQTKVIAIKDINWGFKGKDFFFHTKRLDLNGVNANIYRGKMPPDDLTKKKLFNRLLRDIKFDLRVDTLRIRNSHVVYEEEKNAAFGPGKISFSRFNLWAVNVQSGFGKTKVPDVNIHVNCRFMDVSPFKVDWSFNVLDKSDGFKLSGSLLNFPAEKLTPFTKPYSNTTIQGDLDEVYFNFTGNDIKATGTFGINYDDLKVKIYKKKDREKKNKILSAIANLLIKNDSREKVKRTDVSVERIPEKSFFNLLWRTAADGLKKILL